MNILITGAAGFIGQNLMANLKARRPEITNLFGFDVQNTEEELQAFCSEADFVFHLAGVNRPDDTSQFYSGNRDFTEHVLKTLEAEGNACPVLLTSSTQALLDNDYGNSKRQAEGLALAYGEKNDVEVYVYRLPGVFGKWCRPNYNSVVATFCHNVAHGIPVVVNGRETEVELAYIDDVVDAFFDALDGRPERTGDGFCMVPVTHRTSLGDMIDAIESFQAARGAQSTLAIADLADPFVKKLYSTYLSYLPEDELSYLPKMNIDERGSFTELLKTPDRGQVSVNIVRPGVTKGQHWHNTKNEKFIVLSGYGLVRFRKLSTDQPFEYAVSGERMEVVDIPVGYTHSIVNTGEEDMVVLIWTNEIYDPERPDTYYEEV